MMTWSYLEVFEKSVILKKSVSGRWCMDSSHNRPVKLHRGQSFSYVDCKVHLNLNGLLSKCQIVTCQIDNNSHISDSK